MLQSETLCYRVGLCFTLHLDHSADGARVGKEGTAVRMQQCTAARFTDTEALNWTLKWLITVRINLGNL